MALEARCFAAYDGIFNRRQLRALLANPRAAWLIAGPFAGAACLLVPANGHGRWGRLYSLAVDPRYRKQGIAKDLIAASFDWFRAQGLTVCRAEVKSDNLAARRLYAAMGFVEGAMLPHYYGLGEWGLRLSRDL